jgi:hypothetical protein
MSKVLLTLLIMVLSGSLLAQESPITPRAERVEISAGPEVPLVGGYLTVIRWTVNKPGGLPVHYGVVHYGTDPKNLDQTAKNPQVKPLPSIDGLPREPVRPPTKDDLLLYRRIDGFQGQERRSQKSDKGLHHSAAESSRPVRVWR